jgi:ribonuclease BN (tRNA processing enzyme)
MGFQESRRSFARCRGGNVEAGLKHHCETHTSSEDVGKIATAANVKKLVLSHLSPDAVDPDLPEQLLKTARKSFSGEIVVGNDLMEI